MILDSSVLLAVVFREAGFEKLLEAIDASPAVGAGTPTLAEASIVLHARLGETAKGMLERLLDELRIEEIPFGEVHWREAADAFRRFGKGRHPAGLDFGDCMTHAVAILAGEPLLFTGGRLPPHGRRGRVGALAAVTGQNPAGDLEQPWLPRLVRGPLPPIASPSVTVFVQPLRPHAGPPRDGRRRLFVAPRRAGRQTGPPMTRLSPRPRAHPDLDAPGLPPPLPHQDPITALPVLILYPHARCNCRCVMCDIWKIKSKDAIDPGEVSAWLPELRALGVERVVLSGGEALLHPRLEEICASLSDAGIGITLITTGLLLRRDTHWIVRYADDVVTSLDGPPEVHDQVRRIPRAFEKLADGVRAVREADPGREVRVSARCTVQRLNHTRLRETVDAARAAGLDGISFLAADVSSEAFNRPGGWDADSAAPVALNEDELSALEVELVRLEQERATDFASGFIAESPAKLRARIHGHFAALLGRGEFAPHACNAPWVSSVIEADGTVRPCFFHKPLGNIREAGSVSAVINSPAARAWREQLDVRSDPTCRRCVCTLTLREGAFAIPAPKT